MGRFKVQYCPKGHDTFITGREKNGCCTVCARDHSRLWNQEHKAEILPKARIRAREYRKLDKYKKAQARRMKKFKDKLKAERLKIAGRPQPDYCELCEEKAITVWDHDHKTGLFRGWLCDRCNRVLGSVKDDPILLKKFIDYLD